MELSQDLVGCFPVPCFVVVVIKGIDEEFCRVFIVIVYPFGDKKVFFGCGIEGEEEVPTSFLCFLLIPMEGLIAIPEELDSCFNGGAVFFIYCSFDNSSSVRLFLESG